MNRFSQFMIALLATATILQVHCSQKPEAQVEKAPKMEERALRFALLKPAHKDVFNLTFRPHFDLNDLREHDFRFDREVGEILSRLTPEEKNVINQLHAVRQERYFFDRNRTLNAEWANEDFANKKFAEFYAKEEALKAEFSLIVRNTEKREHILDFLNEREAEAQGGNYYRLKWAGKEAGAAAYHIHLVAQFEVHCKTDACKKTIAQLIAHQAHFTKNTALQLQGSDVLPLDKAKVLAVSGDESKAILEVEDTTTFEGSNAVSVSKDLQALSINDTKQPLCRFVRFAANEGAATAEGDTISITKINETIGHRAHDQY